MNYGQVKRRALDLLDELSTAGAIQTTGDVKKKIQDFANDAQADLARGAAKIPATVTITRAAKTDTTETSLPADWHKLNYVLYRFYRDTSTMDYRLLPSRYYRVNKATSKFVITDPNFYAVSLDVHYWKKPALLTFTDVDATDDLLTFEIPDEAHDLMPLFITGHILISSGQAGVGGGLLNAYEQRKAALTLEEDGDSIVRTVENVMGW
jgi:hypothetical protein